MHVKRRIETTLAEASTSVHHGPLPSIPRRESVGRRDGSRLLLAAGLFLAGAAWSPTPAAAAPVSQQQLHERWVARYDGPAATTDQVEGLAVHPQGGVYVTGPSGGVVGGRPVFGIATIRYDAGGRALWTSRYDRTSFDASAGIVVDSNGDAYVVGSTVLDPPFPDILLVKYDARGAFLWDWTYDELDNNDEGVDVALDPTGNVVVVGHANGLTGADYYTVKLDPDGHELWSARYHGGSQSVVDFPVAVAVDRVGRVYVTGTSRGTGTGFHDDIVTVAYDAAGNERWVHRYDGPNNGIDDPADIAVDAQGNITVVGSSDGGRTSFDVVTIRFAPDGTVSWLERYNGNGDGSDAATGLCVDPAGNVYVAGNTFRPRSGFDVLTLKYDAAGRLRWQSFYDSGELRGDHGRRLALDGRGHVFVTGQSYELFTSIDYVTVAYDIEHGRELASARYDGPTSNIDFADFVGTDARGNVYVGGSSDPARSQVPDFAVIKYRLDGACSGSVERFGRPCADSSGQTNTLDWSGCPDQGTAMEVSMATGSTGPCLLVVGFSDTTWAGNPLPFSLDALGAPGCHVYTSLDVTVPFPNNVGRGVVLPLPIPSLSGAASARAFLQGIHLDPAANDLGVVVSDALALTVR